MFLNNPATYLSVSDFKSQANDYDLTPYTDSQLQDILVRASGTADSIMRRSFQPQEKTDFYEGNGTNFLVMTNAPLIYVRNVQLVMPGFAPFELPIGELLVDYERGSIRSYSPMIWRSIGVSTAFPRNVIPILVNYAYGAGWPISAPSFTLANATCNGTLSNVSYDITCTSRTQGGESLESSVQSYTPANGAIQVNITPVLGALVYRVYAAVHGGSRTLVAESPGTNYGTATVTVDVQSLSAPTNYGTISPPTSDTSMHPTPTAIIEAVRMLALAMLYEQNNKANQGIAALDSGKKRQLWRSTEGNSGKGVPLMVQQATTILEPFMLATVF